MSEVVRWVDTPFVTRMRVGSVLDPVSYKVIHIPDVIARIHAQSQSCFPFIKEAPEKHDLLSP
jgi:hypothetical protein